jgi:uncharacterized protein (TIGR02266 family)
MRIKLKYPDVETFIQKYAVNISRGGIFIATKQPKPIGTNIKFEFLLADATGTSVIRGEGQVQWTREYDATQPTKAHGMGVKFTRLDPESQIVVDRALAFRAQAGGPRKGDSEGMNVASVAPPGATPEPMQLPILPPEPSEPTRLDPLRTASAVATLRTPPPMPALDEEKDEPTRLAPPRRLAAPTMEPREDPTQLTVLPMQPAPMLLSEPTLLTPPELPAPVTTPVAIVVSAPEGRGASDATRPVNVEELTRKFEGRPPDLETRPIELPDGPQQREAMRQAFADDSVRIQLEKHRRRNGHSRTADELEAIASEWGLSPERLERVLRRKRPRMVEATAELERLLRKPPKATPPPITEVGRLLDEILAKPHPMPFDGAPRHRDAHAAGGEPEGPSSSRTKRAR